MKCILKNKKGKAVCKWSCGLNSSEFILTCTKPHKIFSSLVSVVWMDTPESISQFHCRNSTFYLQKEWGSGWGLSHELIFNTTSSLVGSRNKYCRWLVFKYQSFFPSSLTPHLALATGCGEAVHLSVEDSWLRILVSLLNHRVVIAVNSSQDGVVEGGSRAVWAFRGAVGVLAALTTEDLSEGGTHLLVPVGVDDGVHGRVEFSEEEEKFLISQNIALWATHI